MLPIMTFQPDPKKESTYLEVTTADGGRSCHYEYTWRER